MPRPQVSVNLHRPAPSRQSPGNKFPAILWCAGLAHLFCAGAVRSDQPELLVHLPLTGDVRDKSPHGWQAINHGAELSVEGARFDGRDDWLEVSGEQLKLPATGDFSWCAWVSVDDRMDDVPGDLLSWYDPALRRGVHLSLKTHEVTTSRSQSRTLHFGIDNGDQPERHWQDHGQVGKAVLVFALAVYKNQLFAATSAPGNADSGGVYYWDGHDRWIDCRHPTKSNAVSSLAVVDGKLYAGTAKYRLAGSALPESTNSEIGGEVYRFEAVGQWTPCGRLPDTEAIGGMTGWRGRLYAGSLYRPAGFFRYEGDQTWKPLATPAGKRVESLCIHNGQLFASGYDEAHVYRFDGEQWADCGQVGEVTNTQTYSFAVYRGRLYVGTWRSGKVFRYDGDHQWRDCGRLGEELEVMGMLVHNGRLFAGSLPLAGVFEFDGDANWRSIGRVDRTPDVTYRRAWTMAEFAGRLFVGTLPSGRVWSTTVGVNVTRDDEFPPGWHHVAAVRSGRRLRLYLDGKRAAESTEFDPDHYNLSITSPLMLGRGANDFFCGQLRDVRIYRGGLDDTTIATLAERSK